MKNFMRSPDGFNFSTQLPQKLCPGETFGFSMISEHMAHFVELSDFAAIIKFNFISILAGISYWLPKTLFIHKLGYDLYYFGIKTELLNA